MERRSLLRQPCDLGSLVLLYGCHFRSRISDRSPAGVRLVLLEDPGLSLAEHFILYCEGFDVLHGEVIWKNDREIGARICNPKTASLGTAIHLLQQPVDSAMRHSN